MALRSPSLALVMGAARNHSGSAAISNLQALCFRGIRASYGHCEAGCAFCVLEDRGRVLLENEPAMCMADAYPMSEGHSLVVPHRQLSARPQWWGHRRGEGEGSAGSQGGGVDALVRSPDG